MVCNLSSLVLTMVMSNIGIKDLSAVLLMLKELCRETEDDVRVTPETGAFVVSCSDKIEEIDRFMVEASRSPVQAAPCLLHHKSMLPKHGVASSTSETCAPDG